MENSENKSLISTGSSNLAKTEKLLSITKKILSEIKPQYESVKIGNQEWMTRNLDVDRFRNGDLIPHIKSNEEWEKAGLNGLPAWCHNANDPDNGKKYGKLYNWYAVNDPRGLAPEGWHIPFVEEWEILVKFLGKDVAGHKMKSSSGWVVYSDSENLNVNQILDVNGDNCSGFNGLPGGYRFGFDNCFYSIGILATYWCDTKYSKDQIKIRVLCCDDKDLRMDPSFKSDGNSVRCIKDSSDSKWLQAVKAGTIKPYIPPGLKLK